jgi:hypothetical protein
MTLLFLFYCLLSIVFVLGISYYFNSVQQDATAILVFIGSLVCVIVYGVRWFSLTGDLKGNAAGGQWPPVINYCPDFMTLTTNSSGKKVCIDTVGVGFNVDNPIQVWTSSSQSDDSRYTINQSGNPCEQAKNIGVTWEGIFNGATCNNVAVQPTPP